jgi:large subunit ribosomal protein L24e
MPRTRECDFCGADIEPGTGTMLVLNDGTTHHFCSSKCEKNTGIGREARNLEWTEAGRRAGASRARTRDTEAPEDEADAADVDADVEPDEDEEPGTGDEDEEPVVDADADEANGEENA